LRQHELSSSLVTRLCYIAGYCFCCLFLLYIGNFAIRLQIELDECIFHVVFFINTLIKHHCMYMFDYIATSIESTVTMNIAYVYTCSAFDSRIY